MDSRTPQREVLDGITRAEKRILSKAGIDVLMTNTSFRQPCVVDTAPSLLQNPQRKVWFARDALSQEDAQSKPPAIEQLTTSKGTIRNAIGNVYPDFLRTSMNADTDNTDSYDKVRRIIFDQAIQYNVTKLEQKHVNFTDIVDINDNHALENKVTEDLAARFGEGDIFRLFMLSMIIINSIIIGLQTDENFVDMLNVTLLLLVIMFIWAVIGVTLFGTSIPSAYGDLQSRGGLSESRARTEEEHQGAQVHKRRAGQKQDTPQVTQKHAFRREHCVEKPNTVRDPVAPPLTQDFDKISKAKVENYFLLLDIIEQNLHEAIELKKRLREIQFELRLMNANFNEDEVVDENEAEEINKLDDEGDALSRWIKSQ
ncbi:hypothetical protein HDU84_005890 [Entophlyctis sp. JEL0112]|nr:hypothetical protein HDU84_005890 [Entophlyctis sp. JEL0112]